MPISEASLNVSLFAIFLSSKRKYKLTMFRYLGLYLNIVPSLRLVSSWQHTQYISCRYVSLTSRQRRPASVHGSVFGKEVPLSDYAATLLSKSQGT